MLLLYTGPVDDLTKCIQPIHSNIDSTAITIEPTTMLKESDNFVTTQPMPKDSYDDNYGCCECCGDENCCDQDFCDGGCFCESFDCDFCTFEF